MSCYRCICQFCANGVELDLQYLTPGELEFYCFDCDECKHYDGDFHKRSKWKENCPKHKEAAKYIEMKAQAARKKFKVLGGKGR